MKEIEIILIDDCSKDKTLLKIQNYMIKDKRIRLSIPFLDILNSLLFYLELI